MILILCAGAVVLLCIILIGYLVFFQKPFHFKKEIDRGNATVTLEAKAALSRASLVCASGKDELRFERKNIKAGETIVFVYPAGLGNARLIVEAVSGNAQTFEV